MDELFVVNLCVCYSAWAGTGSSHGICFNGHDADAVVKTRLGSGLVMGLIASEPYAAPPG